jgi:hypothetical protein
MTPFQGHTEVEENSLDTVEKLHVLDREMLCDRSGMVKKCSTRRKRLGSRSRNRRIKLKFLNR